DRGTLSLRIVDRQRRRHSGAILDWARARRRQRAAWTMPGSRRWVASTWSVHAEVCSVSSIQKFRGSALLSTSTTATGNLRRVGRRLGATRPGSEATASGPEPRQPHAHATAITACDLSRNGKRGHYGGRCQSVARNYVAFRPSPRFGNAVLGATASWPRR